MPNIDTSLMLSMTEAVKEAEKIAIATHLHPDGDAIGSSVGLMHYLESLGKEVSVVLNDRYPDSLAFIARKGIKNISVCEEEPERTSGLVIGSDLIFCLDMNSFGRAEKLEEPLKKAGCRKILIDHHLHPETEAFDIVFSKTDISSTSELLYYILLSTPDINGDAGKLPADAAEALMAGMTTDTNNFSNSVYPSTFGMASQLLAAGVDRDAIIDSLYTNYRETRFRLMGMLLKDRMTITPWGTAYMIINKDIAAEYDIKEGETEGFVNMPLGIRKVRMSFLLKEEDDRFRVSVRSKKGISANRCAAEFFNGGGHEQAAGGKLIKGRDLSAEPDIAEVAEYVEKCTYRFFNEKI